jgi:hypothetical protein
MQTCQIERAQSTRHVGRRDVDVCQATVSGDHKRQACALDKLHPDPVRSTSNTTIPLADDLLPSIASIHSAMLAQRALLRARPQLALARAPVRRRMYSSETPKQFAGAEDNEFNRERARIAEHAGESGSKYSTMVAVAMLCALCTDVTTEFWWKLTV